MFEFDTFPISETNSAMRKALGDIVVPELLRRGFKGKMPHFRRISKDRVDVLGVQFNRYGGSFVVEIGSCGVEGAPQPDGVVIPSIEVRHFHIPWDRRLRLGSKPDSTFSKDHWFEFRRGTIFKSFDYTSPAREVLALLDSQAEAFWSGCIKKST